MENKLQKILKEYFGYDTFREGQQQLISGILNGKDCLGVMPTGAGKSLCYQVPALMFNGITLVISPLISLMKDQVTALVQAGIKAAFINSSLNERQVRLALNNAKQGMYKIIYIAPERLETEEFLSFALNTEISMVTVDEAHCISQWGQDFRPSYLKIISFLSRLPSRPVVSAFTATATQEVRNDILHMLGLQSPLTLITGFDRQNLFFSVEKPQNKFVALIRFLKSNQDKTGIVYCMTRKTVMEVCAGLNGAGYKSAPYHAGLPDIERSDNQEDFIYDRVKIIVATNAFGMGIDKSNVGFVVHYNMPKNIESYYQEAGRAGRDGEPAQCVMFYSGQDVRMAMFLIDNNKDTEYADAETEKVLKERDRKRLKEMTFYCHTSDCLRRYILNYFGEKADNYCGNCGNCLSNFEIYDVTIEAQKILSCVIKSGERYGTSTIIDILRGSKNEKLKRLRLDTLSTYNISTLSEKKLRDIINYLVLKEILFITDDKYPVLKRGEKAFLFLRSEEKLEMKLVKDEKPVYKNAVKTVALDRALFEKLKELRFKIAKEQGVPAFVIFADSTLTDMCMKLPSDSIELLEVSGVGVVKARRYGSRFLEAIAQYRQEHGEQVAALNKEESHSGAGSIETSDEDVSIRVIADRFNCILIENGMGKVTAAKVNDWLIEEGYLTTKTENGRTYKLPTQQGLDAGIKIEPREVRGEKYYVNLYDSNAQAIVAAGFERLLSYLEEKG